LKDFAADNSAWADFLISKAALILASIILFAALFHLAAGFKDFETQKQLDYLAWDFKNAVDKTGAGNFREEFPEGSPEEPPEKSPGFPEEFTEEFKEISYCFIENEFFRALPFGGDIKIRVSGEYITLEAESNGRSYRAVRPFAFRVMSFNESVFHERLRTRFGTEGSMGSPIKANYAEIKAFIQVLGTEEALIIPEKSVSLKKELVYIKDEEGVSTFACVLIYQ
jgi:hypothetical protein